jgi:hypothetical protein
MTGFGIQAIQTTSSDNCYPKTRAQMREIQQALDAFVRANNHYPSPAERSLNSSAANYGLSTGGTVMGTLRVGALPFVTLGLSSSYAADCWGNKFTYYVTSDLTSASTYMNSGSEGRITVRTGTLGTPHSITATAAYAVISHGEDAIGAAPRNSGGSGYCNLAAHGNRIDKENCDTSNETVFSATFNNGKTDGTLVANYFDDLVLYAEKTGKTGCNTAINWSETIGPDTNQCTGPTGVMDDGHSMSVMNTRAGYAGTATFTCANGTISTTNSNCKRICTATTANWSAGSSNCSASIPGGTITQGTPVPVSYSNGGVSGSGQAICNSNGSITVPSGSCGNDCGNQTVSWGTGCTATATARPHDGTTNVTNTSVNFVGSATATCTNGSFTASGSCVAKCTAGSSVSWGGHCSASLSGPLDEGATVNVTNTAGNYTGSTNVTCNASGQVVPTSGSSCTPSAPCDPNTITWGSCSGPIGSMVHGATATVANTAGGWSGNVNVQCNNGSWQKQPGESCTIVYNDCSGGQTVSWGSGCSATAPAMAHNGAAQTVNNAASGRIGTANVTCNNGTPTASGNCYVNCDPQTVSWGSGCSGSVGALSHSGSTTVTNTAGGYTGTVNVSCNNNTISPSGGTCEVANTACGPIGSAYAWNGSSWVASGAPNWPTSSVGQAANAAPTTTNRETYANNVNRSGDGTRLTCLGPSENFLCFTPTGCSSDTYPHNECGSYIYHDGTTVTDIYPQDYKPASWSPSYTPIEPPPGWRFCKGCYETPSPYWNSSHFIWGGGCYQEIEGLGHGYVTTVGSGATGMNGYLSVYCFDGNYTIMEETCSASTNPCAAHTMTWWVNGQACTGSVSGASHGQQAVFTDNVGPSTGSSTYSCFNGSWYSPSNQTCSGGSSSSGPTCDASKLYSMFWTGSSGHTCYAGDNNSSTGDTSTAWGWSVISGSCSDYRANNGTCSSDTVVHVSDFSLSSPNGYARYKCSGGNWQMVSSECSGNYTLSCYDNSGVITENSYKCPLTAIGGGNSCIESGKSYTRSFTGAPHSGCIRYQCTAGQTAGTAGWQGNNANNPASCATGINELTTGCQWVESNYGDSTTTTSCSSIGAVTGATCSQSGQRCKSASLWKRCICEGYDTGANCPAQTHTWSVNGHSCFANGYEGRSGMNYSMTNARGGYHGGIRMECHNGVWSAPLTQSCTPGSI